MLLPLFVSLVCIRILVSHSIVNLLFTFLEGHMPAQKRAVFLDLYLALNFALVFARPIDLSGLFVAQLNELDLFGHGSLGGFVVRQ